jgi:G3E family GTPase
MFMMALRLDPENAEAMAEAEKLEGVLRILKVDVAELAKKHDEGKSGGGGGGGGGGGQEDSFTYRARRPFHPGRLYEWMTRTMGLSVKGAGKAGNAEVASETAEEARKEGGERDGKDPEEARKEGVGRDGEDPEEARKEGGGRDGEDPEERAAAMEENRALKERLAALVGEAKKDEKVEKDEKDEPPAADGTTAGISTGLAETRARAARDYGHLRRSVGCMWIATRPGGVGEWDQSGPVASLLSTHAWAASVPREEWPTDEKELASILEDFVEEERNVTDPEDRDSATFIGDRRQELQFSGASLNQAKLTAALDACLLTPEELKQHHAWCRAVRARRAEAEPVAGSSGPVKHPFAAVDPFDDDWDVAAAGTSPYIDISKYVGTEEENKTSGSFPPNHDLPLDVLIVGAGASGVGMGLMLTRVFGLDPSRVLLVERGGKVGETFRRWPKEMRFISPSFNQQGWTKSFDLNSVYYGTSPAFSLHAEHPTGQQYARYLGALAEAAQLPVRAMTEVAGVQPLFGGGFNVDVVPAGGGGAAERLQSRFVIWAAGEFQYPRASGSMFPGSELCLHNSSVRSWADLPGDDLVVIGGYESGMDAAFNLATCGKRCTVVSSTAYWRIATEDPSTELAPYTAERIRAALATPTPPRLLAPLRVFKVERAAGDRGGGKRGRKQKNADAGGDTFSFLGAAAAGGGKKKKGSKTKASSASASAEEKSAGGGYVVHARWGAPPKNKSHPHRDPLQSDAAARASASSEGTEITLRTSQPPLLCAGFEGSVALGVVSNLFAWGKSNEEGGDGCAAGSPLLRVKNDESTTTPGLFLAGPAVRHGELSFCFVYKFRQRFGVVADAIAQGLGRDTMEAVKTARDMNMYMDDFTCCKAACGESC